MKSLLMIRGIAGPSLDGSTCRSIPESLTKAMPTNHGLE